MSTALDFLINYVDSDVDYATTPADYISVDKDNDYLIWSKSLDDLLTHEPNAAELNAAAEEISDSADVTFTKCLLMDYSHNVNGSYYTHLVKGMGENKRYVFCFSLDGATATEPQLEAWDDDNHNSADKYVLGAGTPANSMVKAVCTTVSLPGALWAGSVLANSSNVLLLNNGNGALSTPASGTTNDLYANLKIVLPTAYATPAVETFIYSVRYGWV